MALSLTQECSICATTKSKTSSFKEYENTCEHFNNICNLCIAKMLKVKVSERQLADVELRCPFPNCEHSLDHGALRKAIGKEAFEKYEAEVTKYTITTDASYIACLSTECGLHFSIEGLKNSQCTEQSIGCPYCNLETCYKCNRPLYTHDDSSNCNTAKRAEDKESEAEIKKMGAKSCPHCGLKIEKYGGCDYMVCQHCQCEFCWDCLVEFSLHQEHLPSCRNAHSYYIGHGPRDFASDLAA